MLELRTQLRRLVRRPAHVCAVVLSLACGTAVSVAAFSAVNALIFRDLPGIADRRGILRVEWASGSPLLSSAEFRAIGAQPRRWLPALAAQGTVSLPVVLPSGPETLSVAFVSGAFFDTLGTRSVIGRLIAPADNEPSSAPIALISERVWRRAFNGDRAALQRPLTIADRSFTVAGVTPDRFAGLRIIDAGADSSEYPDAWICLRDAALWPLTAGQATPWLLLGGRLPDDVSPAAARSEMDVIAARVTAAAREDAAHRRTLRAYRAGLDWRDEPGQSLLTLALFLFIPLSVLGIGCVNVVNLQLARAMDEAGELSLRLALGASQWRIVRLLLAEVAALALLSAALGLAGARVLLLRAAAVSPVPPTVDAVAVVFTALLVTAVVSVSGLLPAWWCARDVVAAGLRELRDSSRARVRFRRFLVMVQVAASVVLLALGGLATRTLMARLSAAGGGAERVLAADFDFRTSAARDRADRFVAAIGERLRDAPSVRGAAFTTFTVSARAIRYGRASDGSHIDRIAAGGFVTPAWFDVTGAAFVAGGVRDRFSRGTAVVNRALAASLNGGPPGDTLGSTLSLGPGSTVEIVGVVEDTERGGDGRPLPMLLLPMPSPAPPVLSLVVLTEDFTRAREEIHAAVKAVDPSMPVTRLQTLDGRIADASRGLRALASAAAMLGLLSVALAGAGLHSLLAYAVRRRRREIGIRVALGARTREVVRLALGPAVWLVLAGAAAGMAVAVATASILRASLAGVSPIDPAALLPGLAVLLAAAVAGAAGPTLQAIRVEPLDALRDDG